MKVEPQKEHKWLERLVGTWNYESDSDMGPGQPPSKFSGTEVVRTLGFVWVICEGKGEMPGGGTGLTVMTLGYDTPKKRFVGTFIGSMMTHLWIYDGALDAGGTKLVLDSEGPSFAPDAPPGTMAKYKDTIEFKSDNERTLSSSYLGPDGKWHSFMTASYKRVK
jgi:uncharacterized protein DUF1579